MEYADPRWKTLSGAYRRPYDPTPALTRLEAAPGAADAWAELWNQLHHQGDVGEASYAAVPALVEIQQRIRSLGWNLYALVATIEVERHRAANPALPEWLANRYHHSWEVLLSLALDDLRRSADPLLVRSALSVVALAKGETKLGALLVGLDRSELDELLDERCEWSQLYEAGQRAKRPS